MDKLPNPCEYFMCFHDLPRIKVQTKKCTRTYHQQKAFYDVAPAHFIIECSLFDIGYLIFWFRPKLIAPWGAALCPSLCSLWLTHFLNVFLCVLGGKTASRLAR